MTIGINALYIKWGVNAGTETYFTNIVKPWYEKEDNAVKFTMYCNDTPPWWEGEKEHFKIKLFPKAKSLKNRLFTEQVVFPLTLSKEIEVLFNPGYVGSLFLNVPQVTTIHDGFAWVYPKEIGLARSIYWKTLIPLTARKAKKLIAVSKNTANDIEKFCGISKDKIEVIYEGGSHFYTDGSSSSLMEKYQLKPKSFFHCIGFFKDIKNPMRILEAFKKYKANNSSLNAKLVLAGHVGGERANEVLEYANSLEGVIYVGRINDDELVELYKNSLGLIFPSLYEGFGIPILEAQTFGCPVVTSNVSAMPEVAGDGAIIVDPLSVDDIANAFVRLSNEDVSEMINGGYENLKRFSWDRASEETLKVLIEVGVGR